MSYGQACLLALIQGLTEFLPISSSGHLVVTQKLLGLHSPVIFDILVHLGTLMAVLIFFRIRLKELLQGLWRREKPAWNLMGQVALATIPAVILGLLLKSRLEMIFDSYRLVGGSLLVTALILWSTRRPKKETKDLEALKAKDSLLVGLAQALAILPGISRSGATIAAGLGRQLDQSTAFFFSFLLAIPAIIGAAVLHLPEMQAGMGSWNMAWLGMLVAGLTGFVALLGLEKLLARGRLWLLSFYCLFLGLSLIVFG